MNSALAMNQSKCSKLLNNGLYKKYEYGGIDQPLTKATKKHGSSKGTSATSTEGSTASLDPKYWSNITTSETQFISSSGACSAIALNQIKENRSKYIAQNFDEIKKEIAQADGEHLSVLAMFSLCDKSSEVPFMRALQKDFKKINSSNSKTMSDIIDNKVKKSKVLALSCHSFS